MSERAERFTMVVLSVFLGMTALLVSFVAGAAFETPGTTSKGEVIAPCVAAALYLAFCQFWVTPRGSSGCMAKLPTVIGSVGPTLVVVALMRTGWGVYWLAAGCLGTLVGAMIAQRVTATQRLATAAGSISRLRTRRKYLLAGFILLVAAALLISVGVIPSVVTDTTHRFNAGPAGVFLGATVVIGLMAAAVLAPVVWGSRKRERLSKSPLGLAAFLALFLGLSYGGFANVIGGHGQRTASVLLALCAVFGLITTALMTVTSVMVDRARLQISPVQPAEKALPPELLQ